jgi:hypothetical protein
MTEHKKELGLAALGAAAVAGVGFMLASRNGNGASSKGAKNKERQRS